MRDVSTCLVWNWGHVLWDNKKFFKSAWGWCGDIQDAEAGGWLELRFEANMDVIVIPSSHPHPPPQKKTKKRESETECSGTLYYFWTLL